MAGSRDSTTASTTGSPYRMGSWTVTQLKQELRQRRLPTTGLKVELIERLEKEEGLSPAKSITSTSTMITSSPSTPRGRPRTTIDTQVETSATKTLLYSDRKLTELKEELRALGGPIWGTKQQLVERLIEIEKSPMKKEGAAVSSVGNPFVESTPSPAKRRLSNVKVPSPSPLRSSPSQLRSSPSQLRSSPSQLRSSPRSSPRPQSTSIQPDSPPRPTLSWLSSPHLILFYATLYCGSASRSLLSSIYAKPTNWITAVLVAYVAVMINILNGPHQVYLMPLRALINYYGRWLVLGFMSSAGLGFGLHTFVFFLGPFIARATNTAHACHSLNIVFNRETDKFKCLNKAIVDVSSSDPSILGITRIVALESFAWGLGTVIGELPPYFIARWTASAGKQSGLFLQIDEIRHRPPQQRTFLQSIQLTAFNLVNIFGFWGILVGASIPNPFFDLTGIACGYFGIPASTFFLALFLGKAIIKTFLQTAFVVFLFTKSTVDWSLSRLSEVAPSLGSPVQSWLEESRHRLQDHSAIPPHPTMELLGTVVNYLVVTMVAYFVLTAVRALAILHLRKSA